MRSPALSSRDEAIRRVAFWAAMLTGVALVSLQFGCAQPQASVSTAGFPHASRRVEPVIEPAANPGLSTEAASKEEKASLYWTSPRPVERPISRANSLNVRSEWSRNTRLVELSRLTAQAAGKPLFTADVEAAK